MRKKDYILLANVLRIHYMQYKTVFGITPMENKILEITNDLGSELKRDNPNFDKEKFLNAIKA